MIKNMANSHRMGGKLDETWKGPYIIEEIHDKAKGRYRYRLKSRNGKVLKKLYNGILFKEFYSPSGSNANNVNDPPSSHQQDPSGNPTHANSDQPHPHDQYPHNPPTDQPPPGPCQDISGGHPPLQDPHSDQPPLQDPNGDQPPPLDPNSDQQPPLDPQSDQPPPQDPHDDQHSDQPPPLDPNSDQPPPQIPHGDQPPPHGDKSPPQDPHSDQPNKKWFRFDADDQVLLSKKGWLTDRHIHAAQTILKHQ